MCNQCSDLTRQTNFADYLGYESTKNKKVYTRKKLLFCVLCIFLSERSFLLWFLLIFVEFFS